MPVADLIAALESSRITLPGFNTFKREGIVLTAGFTATVNADMPVGALEETITVTGESPIVDVQSVRRQTVIDDETISAIPGTRHYTSLMQLMPNTVTAGGSATDVQVVPGMVVFGGAGGRSNEGRVNIDGISVGSAFNGAGVSSYIADVGNAREIADRRALYEDPPLFSSEVGPACGPSIRQGVGAMFALWSKYLGDQWSVGDWDGMVAAAPGELPAWLAALFSQPAPAPLQNLKEYDPEWARAFWTGTVAASCDHARMLASVAS